VLRGFVVAGSPTEAPFPTGRHTPGADSQPPGLV